MLTQDTGTYLDTYTPWGFVHSREGVGEGSPTRGCTRTYAAELNAGRRETRRSESGERNSMIGG
jgi:hypothetical protein